LPPRNGKLKSAVLTTNLVKCTDNLECEREFRSFFVHKSVQLNAHFVLDLGKSAQKLKMPGNAAKRPILLNIPERDLEMMHNH